MYLNTLFLALIFHISCEIAIGCQQQQKNECPLNKCVNRGTCGVVYGIDKSTPCLGSGKECCKKAPFCTWLDGSCVKESTCNANAGYTPLPKPNSCPDDRICCKPPPKCNKNKCVGKEVCTPEIGKIGYGICGEGNVCCEPIKECEGENVGCMEGWECIKGAEKVDKPNSCKSDHVCCAIPNKCPKDDCKLDCSPKKTLNPILWSCGEGSGKKCCESSLTKDKLNGKYYYIEKSKKLNWFGARRFCMEHNGDLASIETQAEREALAGQLKKDSSVMNQRIWISGNDLVEEAKTDTNKFVWLPSYDPVTSKLNAWSSSEPNDYGGAEDCMMVKLPNAGAELLLYDDRCDTKKFLFICEFS